MKIFIMQPNEGWIVDRFVDEWRQYSGLHTVWNPYDADVIWLLADWCFDQLPISLLRDKIVVTTIHHIVPEKFDDAARSQFALRDSVTDLYHVYNERTLKFISDLTTKPIKLVKYWANQRIWRRTMSTEDAKRSLNIADDLYVIGSFQRDTEGNDLISPKLEKGPDLFVDAVLKIKQRQPNVFVLLGGWRRQYVISHLKENKVPYMYKEDNDPRNQPHVNRMYEALDLYAVTARYEGGPQALLECGLVGVPTVSRPVGIAEQVLSTESINDDVSLAIPHIPIIDKHTFLPHGMTPYIEMFQDVKWMK